MPPKLRYDALIVGGGHNGLVCAWYLAKKGGLRNVRVLERRPMVGGCAVTEAFYTDTDNNRVFRNSTASYTVGLLQPKIIQDMRLYDRGLRIVQRPISNFLPLDHFTTSSSSSSLPTTGGPYLKLGGGLARTQAEFRRFSLADADMLPRYYDTLETVAAVVRDFALKSPPNIMASSSSIAADASTSTTEETSNSGGSSSSNAIGNLFRRQALTWRRWLAAIVHGQTLSTLTTTQQRHVLDLFTLSARDFLTRYFTSDAIQAAFGFDAIVGNYASPDTPGSAYVLLHHVFGEVNGIKGAWGHAIGGMGAISDAMRVACEDVGVTISTDCAVERVLVDNDNTAVGVRLADGTELKSDHVVANVGPKLLYERLVDASDVPDNDFMQAIRNYKVGSGTFRMNVAISELPNFTCLPREGDDRNGEHYQSGIILAPSLDYMDRAYHDARHYGWSKQPVVEICIPSTVDDSLAPPGTHVASLFCQHFAPQLPGGINRHWRDEREAAADCIIDTVNTFAPNFKASVLGRSILSPYDLEERFGLVGGDIMHGAMTLNQLWAARPVYGYGDYRSPIRNLYLCGSGTHPGGGVTGAPGHNAAHEILADVALRRQPLSTTSQNVWSMMASSWWGRQRQ